MPPNSYPPRGPRSLLSPKLSYDLYLWGSAVLLRSTTTGPRAPQHGGEGYYDESGYYNADASNPYHNDGGYYEGHQGYQDDYSDGQYYITSGCRCNPASPLLKLTFSHGGFSRYLLPPTFSSDLLFGVRDPPVNNTYLGPLKSYTKELHLK
ncbi:hypothetical protein CLAIMM_02480 [Cladophialophora immunda]|nr:hypothetical protein CLAIMM_02480 [Cladophialophora immunda]